MTAVANKRLVREECPFRESVFRGGLNDMQKKLHCDYFDRYREPRKVIFILKKNLKNDDSVIFAGVYAKQACCLLSGEYGLSAGASL